MSLWREKDSNLRLYGYEPYTLPLRHPAVNESIVPLSSRYILAKPHEKYHHKRAMLAHYLSSFVNFDATKIQSRVFFIKKVLSKKVFFRVFSSNNEQFSVFLQPK